MPMARSSALKKGRRSNMRRFGYLCAARAKEDEALPVWVQEYLPDLPAYIQSLPQPSRPALFYIVICVLQDFGFGRQAVPAHQLTVADTGGESVWLPLNRKASRTSPTPPHTNVASMCRRAVVPIPPLLLSPIFFCGHAPLILCRYTVDYDARLVWNHILAVPS